MQVELSQEAEEYLEAIYRLQKRDGAAKTNELSQTLHVVPGSITNTIEHLESHSLVTHVPYRGVRLTGEGEKIALSVIRRHRLAERLLTDILKAEWSNVHEDACLLEHAMTPRVVALLEERLGYPKCCPHGNPIPTETGAIKEQTCLALTEATQGESYIVDRIEDEEPENLRILAEKNIKPETQIRITKRDSQQLTLLVEGKEYHLNTGVAANVYVRKAGRHSNAI
jgi:DtxR family transcriptional regulator, Mn-dependent transcriptional regulator